MNYHIKLEDGSTLASFENEYDRDTFLDVLKEEHSDVGDDYFNAVNEEKPE